MDHKFKTYTVKETNYENYKLDKECLTVEPAPFWDNFKLGFGKRLFSLMKIENLTHEDLFRISGNNRHRRQVARFYQIWSGSYNSKQFRKAKNKWY
jgi:hypothetical protein